MRKFPLVINDGSGGLNDRDPASGIAKNEFSILENYYPDDPGAWLKKRGGKELIQYAPIDPQLYVNDANTLVHHSFDETLAASAVADSSGNAIDLQGNLSPTLHNAPGTGAAIFPVSAPRAREGYRANIPYSQGGGATPAVGDGTCMYFENYTTLEDKTALTMRGWLKITPRFSGRPQTVSRDNGSGTINSVTYSNSGAHLYGTTGDFGSGFPGETSVGFRLWRDWDSTLKKDSSGPYLTFRLPTKGIPGTVTTLRSRELPLMMGLEVKVTYNGTTGELKLWVLGNLHDSATVNGAGAIDEAATAHLAAFGNLFTDGQLPGPPIICKSCDVILDEWEISDSVKTGFPFKNPRGKGFELSLPDGTRRLVVSAEESLYYTLGTGEWFNLDSAQYFNTTAYWDAVQLGNIMYLANGTDEPVAWDGSTLIRWGVPTTAPNAVEQASGSLANGVYKYVYTYLYGTEETGISPVKSITTTGGFGVGISGIPQRHANCTACRVYRTVAGGDQYFLIREITRTSSGFANMAGAYVAGSTSPKYLSDAGGDEVADASLNTADYPPMVSFVLTSLMPQPKYLLAEHRRIECIGMDDEPYTLRWSEMSAPDCFRAFSYTKADANSGPLIGLASYYGEIHASKDAKATLILRGDGPSNWVQFETLHPTVGAIDHWSYVHRYPIGADRYVLCFAGRDGFYKYSGQAIERISDKVNSTMAYTPQRSATLAEWLVSTQTQFQEMALGPDGPTPTADKASINISAAPYSVDGLTEEPGRIKLVNQLDEIGLWDATASTLPTNVNGDTVIAICPMKVADVVQEGKFLFSLSDDSGNNNLYMTTDNFITATVVTHTGVLLDPLNAALSGHKIIEITYAYIGTEDKYFVATSTTDEKGYWALWNQTALVWDNAVHVMPSPLADGFYYWQGDVPWLANATNPSGGQVSVPEVGARQSGYQKTAFAIGNGAKFGLHNSTAVVSRFASGNNIHLNHAQSVTLDFTVTTGVGVQEAPRVNILPQTSLTSDVGTVGVQSTVGSFLIVNEKANEYQEGAVALAVGFYAVSDDASWKYGLLNQNNNNFWRYNGTGGFTVAFTRRETALWQGGTFRPQSFWTTQGTDSIWFVASGAEDSNGNRTSYIYAMTPTGTVTQIYSPGNSVIALTNDGTNAWFTYQTQYGASSSFLTYLAKALLSSGAVTGIGQVGSGSLPLRLSWNANTSMLKYVGKVYANTYDSYTHYGVIADLNTTTGAQTLLKTFTAETNAGPIPLEIAYQTDTPFCHYAVIQNLTTTQPQSVYKIAKSAFVAGDVTIYKSSGYDSTTKGIRSNLTYVSASDTAGNYLWSDRLYWAATRDTDSSGTIDEAKPIQLGVPGDWEIRGEFYSERIALGSFDAFGNFETDFTGTIDFFLRNGDNVVTLDSTEEAVVPNAKISSAGFAPPKAYTQWRAHLVWEYKTTPDAATPTVTPTPTVSPEIDFVAINYFFGAAALPRIVGAHYLGRTYWTIAYDTTVENNILMVYLKNNTWAKITNWRFKSIFFFRNRFLALEDYSLLEIEKGNTDLGEMIPGRARTGYIMGYVDKMVEGVQANVLAYVNNDFPTKAGYVKVAVFQGDTEMPDGVWVLPIPASTSAEVRRVRADPYDAFSYSWARAFAIEIRSSEDVSGDWAGWPAQPEVIQAVELALLITGETDDLPVT